MAALSGEPAYYVESGRDNCQRCGDQNYDDHTRVCFTCTHPDDPCSRAWWDMNPDAIERMKNRRSQL